MSVSVEEPLRREPAAKADQAVGTGVFRGRKEFRRRQGHSDRRSE